MKNREICPEPNSIIYFSAATVYAEKINKKEKRVQISKAHRGYVATVDNGYMIIDKKWYS